MSAKLISIANIVPLILIYQIIEFSLPSEDNANVLLKPSLFFFYYYFTDFICFITSQHNSGNKL